MKGLFGLVALVLVLVFVLLNVKHSMTAAKPATVADGPSTAPRPLTPRQQVDAVERDVNKAIAQGAAMRASEAE